jgi:putative membrane protein
VRRRTRPLSLLRAARRPLAEARGACENAAAMPGFLLRLLVTALGLWAADALLDGVRISGPLTLLLAALLLGFVNAIVRPLVVILTLPITLVTLGLFLLVVNAAMLGLVALLLPGFHIAGLFSGICAWLIVSLTGWLAAQFIGPRGRYEVLVVDRRRD